MAVLRQDLAAVERPDLTLRDEDAAVEARVRDVCLTDELVPNDGLQLVLVVLKSGFKEQTRAVGLRTVLDLRALIANE